MDVGDIGTANGASRGGGSRGPRHGDARWARATSATSFLIWAP